MSNTSTRQTALHASTGGADHVEGQPFVTFVHGAAGNRSGWALQARHFAARQWNVLAYDLPGHGNSDGPACATIGELADVVAADLDRRGVGATVVVGHSMGGLIALELAARRSELVTKVALVGSGLALAVNDALLTGTRDTPELAVDAIMDWGLSGRSHLGNGDVPGLWLEGANRATSLEEVRRHPGSIAADFAACAAYDGGPAAAAAIAVPVLVISGGADVMTPPRLGRQVVDTVANGRYVEFAGAGHMLMSERTKAVTAELWRFCTSG